MGPAEWAAIIVALLALIGTAVTGLSTYRLQQQLRRDRATELEDTERRDKRDQAVEIYQWAAKLAVSSDEREAKAGVDALEALLEGDLLDDDVKVLVETALASAYAGPMTAIEQALAADQPVVVRQTVEAHEAPDVTWTQSHSGDEEAPDG